MVVFPSILPLQTVFSFSVLHLLETGVDPNGADDKKRTSLHFAAAKGHDNIGRHFSVSKIM
jgi:ankyrin repeat protein